MILEHVDRDANSSTSFLDPHWSCRPIRISSCISIASYCRSVGRWERGMFATKSELRNAATKSSPFCKRVLHNHTTPPILILESYIRARKFRRTTSGHLDFAIDLPREQRLDRKTLHHHGADDIATPSHPQSAIDFETSISTRECVAIQSDCG